MKRVQSRDCRLSTSFDFLKETDTPKKSCIPNGLVVHGTSVAFAGKLPFVIFFLEDVNRGTLGNHINLRQFITVPTE